MDNKALVVVGAGPGVGASVAHRFGREGYDVALVARSEDALQRLGSELEGAGVAARWSALDITDAEALTAAITRFAEDLGHLDALHFNPSVFRPQDPLHLTAEELLEDLGVGVAALLTSAAAAVPAMPVGGRITVTGSMAADHPSPGACSLGVQKAGLRNLVLSLDRSLEPRGIRAMSLTVNGTLAPDGAFSPERVADAIFRAAATPDERWLAEVAFDG